jgi:hypothetical protein
MTIRSHSTAGVGRIDTIAREIGHSLGLPHCNDADRLEAAACGADFLMRSAGRTIPAAVGDIDPNGLKLDKLSAVERAAALRSPLVPEPSTWLLTLVVAPLFLRARKRG